MPAPVRFLSAAALALLAAFAAPLARAQADPAATTEAADPGDPPGQTQFAPTRTRAASPFAAELRAAEHAHAEALAALRARLANAPREERPALQREIEALKREREVRLVRVQLADARRRGRGPLAARLETRLARLAAAGAHDPVTSVGGAR